MAHYSFRTHLASLESEYCRVEAENRGLRKLLADSNAINLEARLNVPSLSKQPAEDVAALSLASAFQADDNCQVPDIAPRQVLPQQPIAAPASSSHTKVPRDLEMAFPLQVFQNDGIHAMTPVVPLSPERRLSSLVVLPLRRQHSRLSSNSPSQTSRQTSQASELGMEFPVGGRRMSKLVPSIMDLFKNSGNESQNILSYMMKKQVERPSVFPDAEGMKERVRQQVMKKRYDVAVLYKEDGCAQAIARSQMFEFATLGIISLNTIWIAFDTDHNPAPLLVDAAIGFQIVENLFCAYFFFEICIRFNAFRSKCSAVTDFWFVFDTVLVIMMVFETWVMTLLTLVTDGFNVGNVSVLRVVRLVRLTRMARLARLLRAVPELMILIKGMAAASRSVFFTLLLLLVLIYVFAIAFTQILKSTKVGAQYFPSVAASMNTLWLYATLLEEVTTLSHDLQAENLWSVILLNMFILTASCTVMNMLIGVLCEVVSAVATGERETVSLNFVKHKILSIFSFIGLHDGQNSMISRDEFAMIVENRDAAKAIHELGVDVVELCDMADFIFQSEDGSDGFDKELSFVEFMDTLAQFRGQTVATVKDIMQLRKFIRTELVKERNLSNIQRKLTQSSTAGDLGQMQIQRKLTKSSTGGGFDNNLIDLQSATAARASRATFASSSCDSSSTVDEHTFRPSRKNTLNRGVSFEDRSPRQEEIPEDLIPGTCSPCHADASDDEIMRVDNMSDTKVRQTSMGVESVNNQEPSSQPSGNSILSAVGQK